MRFWPFGGGDGKSVNGVVLRFDSFFCEMMMLFYFIERVKKSSKFHYKDMHF